MLHAGVCGFFLSLTGMNHTIINKSLDSHTPAPKRTFMSVSYKTIHSAFIVPCKHVHKKNLKTQRQNFKCKSLTQIKVCFCGFFGTIVRASMG